MGLKKSFVKGQKAPPEKLKNIFTTLKLLTEVEAKVKLPNRDQETVLVAIIYAFTKISLIDREFSVKEKKEVSKRLSRFIRLDQETLIHLIATAQRDLRSAVGRGSDFVASFYCFLGKKADEKSRNRIYRYLTNIVASDDEVSDEEHYLMELIGMSFDLSEKEIREYLLTSELMTHQDDVPPSEREDTSSYETPIIKFDLK